MIDKEKLKIGRLTIGMPTGVYWYLVGFGILIATFCLMRPFWLTNDDVGLAMVGDGYGIAASANSTLVFSNVVWGSLINWFPNLGGVQSYTWITYFTLAASYLAIHFCLIRSNVRPVLGAALGLIFFLPVFIYPQFTLVSGYLACAAVGLYLVAKGSNQGICIGVAAFLVILSGLVRLQEMLLVIIVGVPFFVGLWVNEKEHYFRKAWLISIGCVVLALIAFHFIDQEAYANPAWRAFDATNKLRAQFTDFNLARFYFSHPDALKDAGYTKNDVLLFRGWFFVDPSVFSPDRISHLIKNVTWTDRVRTNLRQISMFWLPFHDVQILCLLVMTALYLIFNKRRGYLFVSMIVLAGIMLLLLMLGRGGITRIYIPVFVLLSLAGALQPETVSISLRQYYPVVILTAVVAVMVLWVHLDRRNVVDRHIATDVQKLTCQVPNDSLVIIWGDTFPYTHEYQPFRSLKGSCRLKIYSLGAFGLAPFELNQLYAETGYRSLVRAVLAGRLLTFITTDASIGPLRTYFTEHYSVRLVVTKVMKNEYFSVYKIRRTNSETLDGPSP